MVRMRSVLLRRGLWHAKESRVTVQVCSEASLDTPHEGPRKLKLAEVLAEFARLKKENEAHAKRQKQKMNARDSEGNMVNHSNFKRGLPM